MGIKQFFCNHDYSKTNQYTTASEVEMLKKIGCTPNTHCSTKRKIVFEYKCTKCKKLHIKVVAI